MFRKMRRFRQQLNIEECREVLNKETRGVLSVIGDDGYPYGVPIDYWYNAANGNVYFHGAKAGHKIDAIEKCDKASFCVVEQGFKKQDDWAYTARSVIIFGRIHKVTDPALMDKALHRLCSKFPAPEGYAEYEIAKAGRGVLCLELQTEHMSGKRVHEA